MEKFGGVGWWEYLSGEDDCFLFFESTTPATAGRVQIEYTLVGLARTIYIRCIYGIFGRGITKYTVIYGVYIRFWPTLHVSDER